MNTLNYEILNDIDRIDQCVMEAKMNVMSALYSEYDKATMILENYEGDDIESFDIFQEASSVNNVTKKPNIIRRFINWIRKMVSLVFNKIKNWWNRLHDKNQQIEVPVDMKGLNDLTQEVCENNGNTTTNVDDKIKEINNQKTQMSANELINNIKNNIEKCNNKNKELEKEIASINDDSSNDNQVKMESLQKQCRDVATVLKEHNTVMDSVNKEKDSINKIVELLRQRLQNMTIDPVSNNNGKSIKVYPFLSTRTLHNDYHMCLYPETFTKQIFSSNVINPLTRSVDMWISKGKFDVMYIEDYYICFVGMYGMDLAQKCGYNNFEEFDVPGRKSNKSIKYFRDHVGRKIAAYIGVAIHKNQINEQNLPVFNMKEFFNIYINFQKDRYFEHGIICQPTQQTSTLQIGN